MVAIAIVTLIIGLLLTYVVLSRVRSMPCPIWLSWLVELDNPFTKTNRAATIIQHLGLEPGMAVLDAGCGPGRLTVPAARQVGPDGSIVAADIQSGMLRRAKDKTDAAGLTNVRFIQTALGEGKLERNKFDRALLVTVLGEIPDQESALQEIFSALKAGGILSVTEIVFDNHYQSRETVQRLAAACGFREKAFFGNRLAFTLHLERPS
ncbi:MAG TPA: methyltransferase domain-containing protein [Steroidobacteraceae bacterium]|jgi:ubiquinone/menaquinone biosynthesis C-methylase UbiE|nr:methyltransferase domain-containing protein [Steroidobacteraceae bacterium]